jgi:hypothetical protein
VSDRETLYAEYVKALEDVATLVGHMQDIHIGFSEGLGKGGLETKELLKQRLFALQRARTRCDTS